MVWSRLLPVGPVQDAELIVQGEMVILVDEDRRGAEIVDALSARMIEVLDGTDADRLQVVMLAYSMQLPWRTPDGYACIHVPT